MRIPRCAVLLLALLSALPAAAQTRINGMSKMDYFSTTHVDLGNKEAARGNYHGAIEHYQEALEYNPKWPKLCFPEMTQGGEFRFLFVLCPTRSAALHRHSLLHSPGLPASAHRMSPLEALK